MYCLLSDVCIGEGWLGERRGSKLLYMQPRKSYVTVENLNILNEFYWYGNCFICKCT